MRHIKRYSNRKLYDTLVCHYTTLAQIAVEIRAGDEIKVVMHETGADITSQILTQIIAMEAQLVGSNVSVATLREIICKGLLPEGLLPEGLRPEGLRPEGLGPEKPCPEEVASPDGDYFSKSSE